jgi:hypothetical protein
MLVRHQQSPPTERHEEPLHQLEHRLGRARLAIPDHIGHIYLFVIM